MLTPTSLFALDIPLLILQVLYWYTRRTPTGLSHVAMALHGASMLVRVISLVTWNKSVYGIGSAFGSFVFDGLPSLPVAGMILHLIWPFEWVDDGTGVQGRWKQWTRWLSGWERGVRRTRWSRRERRNLRIAQLVTPAQIGAVRIGPADALDSPSGRR
jgi:hypothetical protein